MRLFSEPTYRERMSDYAERLGERVSDGFGRMARPVRDVSDADLGRGLGWASLAIGLTEVLAPRQVNHMLGLADTPDCRGTLRILGVREICHGISLLSEDEANERMKVGLWSRVAGDVLDSALLGVAATKTRKPFAFAVITGMVMAIGLADVLCAMRLSDET